MGKKWLEIIGLVLLVIVIILVLGFIWATVLQVGWELFIVPIFKIPPLTWSQTAGAFMLLTIIQGINIKKE